MNQQTSFERYISLAKSNLENYYATNDVKFLLTSAEQIWMAFRQLVIRKAGLSKKKYVPRKAIEYHAYRLKMGELYQLAFRLHWAHYHYYVDDQDATLSGILKFLEITKR